VSVWDYLEFGNNGSVGLLGVCGISASVGLLGVCGLLEVGISVSVRD
jgi:hypothetical protein